MQTMLSAQIVMTAAMIEQLLAGLGPIAAALLVGWIVLWRGGFGLSGKRAALVSAAMNAAVMVASYALIIGSSLVDWYVPWTPLRWFENSRLFYLVSWGGGFLAAVIWNTGVQALVVRLFRVTLGWKRIVVLGAANLVTSMATLAVLFSGTWMAYVKR
jgi:hypothetical protein